MNFRVEYNVDITDYNFITSGQVDAVCVTTNGIVKSNGELVMGAGVAKQFATKFPNLPKNLGSKVKSTGNHVYVAGVVNHNDIKCSILSFPTKHNFKDKSDLELIKTSARRLVKWADQTGAEVIYLPCPGIGLGGLSPKEVMNALTGILDLRFTLVINKK